MLDLVTAVHTAPAAARARAGADDYAIPHRDELEAAVDGAAADGAAVDGAAVDGAAAAATGETGPFTRPMARLMRAHRAPIRSLLARYDELAALARSEPWRAVLTHGEPHPGNTMATSGGWRLIDWDTALIAQPERDLWLLGREDRTLLEAYAEATGVRPQPSLLELYRIRWDLADLAVDVSRFARPHHGSADDEASWEVLRSLAARVAAGT